MLNFTVGPVMSSEKVRKIGGEQTPYFRNDEFSQVILENERLMKEFVFASENSKTIFITGSGTAAMEASILNVFTNEDKVLIINGGGFGQRFVELCQIHQIPYDEIKLDFGKNINENILKEYSDKGYTGFLVNICETSSGIYYDLDLISNFCKDNNILLVVDAISSFLCDPLNMVEQNIDVFITGSQKALACPPGISILVLSKNALNRIEKNVVKSLYFDLKIALKNAERGQTPFTPAVGILLQINQRLRDIKSQGGVETEIKRVFYLANDFRDRISDLPLKIKTESLSNSVTAVFCDNALEVVKKLKLDYNIWVNPNGGELANKMFRVGHIGDLTINDNDKLIDALHELHNKEVF